MSKKTELDALWAKKVKDRDGWKCVLCGRELGKIGGRANAHHVMKKKSHLLRYDLQNGVCLCFGCHKNGVHSNDMQIAMNHLERLEAVLGLERVEYLSSLKRNPRKLSLTEAEEQLK